MIVKTGEGGNLRKTTDVVTEFKETLFASRTDGWNIGFSGILVIHPGPTSAFQLFF